MKYTYILLILFTLSYPLFKSFEEKIQFYKKWKYLFPAIIISAAIFIPWDIWFTAINMWNFNPKRTLGLFIFGLPIEEWLFFFVVPYACIFIYEVMNYFVKKDVLAPYSKHISTILIVSLITLVLIFHDRFYTIVDLSLLAVFLFVHQFVLRSAYLSRYYLTWLVCMVPFLIVNTILTATPVVIYNDLENMKIKIYTIPLEDLFYGMLQILIVISIYEYLKLRKK